MTKAKVRNYLETISLYTINENTSLSAFIDKLKEIDSKHKKEGWIDIEIIVDGEDYQGLDRFEIYGVKLETDEEFNKRIERLEKAKKSSELSGLKNKDKQKTKDMKEFKRLANKLEIDLRE